MCMVILFLLSYMCHCTCINAYPNRHAHSHLSITPSSHYYMLYVCMSVHATPNPLSTHSHPLCLSVHATPNPLPTHSLTALSRCCRASTTLLVWWYSTRPSCSLTRASIRVEGHRVRVARRQRTDSETRGGVWWRWCSEMASSCVMVGLWRMWMM